MVVGVIIALTFGGWAVASMLAKPAGPPVGIPGVVTVQPLSGWQDAGRDAAAGVQSQRLTRGGGNLDVIAVVPYSQTPRALAEYEATVLEAQHAQLSVSRRFTPVTLANGMLGLRFTYVAVTRGTSQSIEGEVTVVVSPSGSGIVFNGWAPVGLLSYARGDIRTMVFRAQVG